MYIDFGIPMTLESIKDGCQQFYDHPEFRTGMNVLWDARNAQSVDLTYEDMQEFGRFVEQYREHRGGGRSAFVSDQDLIYGLYRMHEMANDNRFEYEFKVFREITEAESWLRGGEPTDHKSAAD